MKTPTGGHYHILEVRDPGGPEQVAECWEGKCDLTFACQYIDEIHLPDTIDEGWEAIWIVGCGPDRCRATRSPICQWRSGASRTGAVKLSTPATKTPISSPITTPMNCRPFDRDDRYRQLWTPPPDRHMIWAGSPWPAWPATKIRTPTPSTRSTADGCLGCVLHILAGDPVVASTPRPAAVLNDKSKQLAGTPKTGRRLGGWVSRKPSHACHWSQLHCAHHRFAAREEQQ
jgi:hypothetical protein